MIAAFDYKMQIKRGEKKLLFLAHRSYDFSFKLRALVGRTRGDIRDEINSDFPNVPAGCHIRLERIAKE